MWEQQNYMAHPYFDVPAYDGFPGNLPPGLPSNLPHHLRSRLGPAPRREAHVDHRIIPQKPSGSNPRARASSSGRAESAPLTPPQSCDEGAPRPKMSRSQARRHRRNILHKVINHPEEAEDFIIQERQRFVDNWYHQRELAPPPSGAQERLPSARSPQGPLPRQGGPTRGYKGSGTRPAQEDFSCGSNSAPGSSVGSERGARERLDQRVRAHTTVLETPGVSSQPKRSLPQLSSTKTHAETQAELEKLKAEKEAAEASAEMLTRQAQALHEERQRIAIEKNALEARNRMLEERLQFFEGTEAHDGNEDGFHEEFENFGIQD